MLCPKPLIMVKAALEDMRTGESLTVILDNQTASENVRRFLEDHKANPDSGIRDGLFVLRATKSQVEIKAPAEAWCAPGSESRSRIPSVVVVNRERMGEGPEELGKILLQAAINTLRELRPLPSAVVFYNSGIHLTCEGSPVLGALADLEKQGVRLLVCGTCLDYFVQKARRKVGVVSNMYDILTTLSGTGTVLFL